MALTRLIRFFPTIGLYALLATTSIAEESKIHLVHGSATGYPYEASVEFPGGEYFAAVCAETCVLRKAQLAVTPARISGYDGATDGYVAAVKQPEASLFLIRGLKHLREGPLKTWYVNAAFQKSPMNASESRLAMPQELSVPVDGAPLSIVGVVTFIKDRSCPAGETGCPRYPEVKWKFRFGAVERTLFTLAGSELGTPIGIDEFVVWIGDLDRDGKPDLVVRPQDRSDYLELSLFLSSTLAPGKPWRPSAKFYWWDPTNPGC